MPNWDQELSEAAEREFLTQGPLYRPFGIKVQTVSPDSELVAVDYYHNRGRVINTVHPFVSMNSWIRAQPESGTQYVGGFRSDEGPPQLFNTFQRGSQDRIAFYKSGNNLYRPLQPGEIEMTSQGYSQVFLPRRARPELRGGILTRISDQDTLSNIDRAPIHHRELLQHKSDGINDIEKLGIISRKENSWKTVFPKVRNNFAAEYYLDLLNPANANPSSLVHIQKGHVLDSDGVQVTQTQTSIPLRMHELYYANDDTATEYQIDENGNIYVRVAEAATEGYQLDVPTGYYRKNVAFDEIVAISKNRDHVIGNNATHSIGDNLTYSVDKNIFIRSERGGQQLVFDSTADKRKVYLKTPGHLMAFDDTTNAEAIYMIHKTGTQLNMEKTGSAKIVTAAGNTMFLDDPNKTVSFISGNGALISAKDNILLSHSNGKNIVELQKDAIQMTAEKDIINQANTYNVNANQVFLGNQTVELVDIVLQALQTLSLTTAAGFNAPISTVGQFALLYTRLLPLKK